MENNKKGQAKAFLSGVFVATAIGGYLLFGSKNAKRNRQKVQDGLEDAKTEVMTRLKKMKRLSRDQYNKVVDEVSDKYSTIKEFGVEKAEELRSELKSRWEEIEEEARDEMDKQ